MSVESRQKRVKNGATSGSTSAVEGLTKNPIYGELFSIGRHQRSIRPEALLGYPHLLSCPEVRRRARSTDPTQLAASASQALHEAIETIVREATRSVAEAALCVTSDFEGLQVSQRWRELPGIDESSFKRHRRRAFEHITAFLTRRTPVDGQGSTEPEAASHTITTISDSKDDARDRENLGAIASNAARVHYAGLGVLFVNRFDHELLQKGDFQDRPETIGTTSIADRFFFACVAYIYSSFPRGTPPWLMDARLTDDFLRRCELLRRADKTSISELVTWWRISAESTPLAPPDVTLRERAALIRSASGEHSGYLPLRHKWGNWLNTVPLGIMYGPFTNKVARMVSISGIFGRILSQTVELTDLADKEARRAAHTAIEDCYWRYDTKVILDGQPVTYFADKFFDAMGPTLTNRAR
jgi:hypothetical protein